MNSRPVKRDEDQPNEFDKLIAEMQAKCAAGDKESCLSQPPKSPLERIIEQSGDPIAGWVGIVMLAMIPVALVAGLYRHRRTLYFVPRRKAVRAMVGLTVLWVLAVQSWGFISEWERVFSSDQYFALNVLPPLGFMLSLFLWRWYRRGT